MKNELLDKDKSSFDAQTGPGSRGFRVKAK